MHTWIVSTDFSYLFYNSSLIIIISVSVIIAVLNYELCYDWTSNYCLIVYRVESVIVTIL